MCPNPRGNSGYSPRISRPLTMPRGGYADAHVSAAGDLTDLAAEDHDVAVAMHLQRRFARGGVGAHLLRPLRCGPAGVACHAVGVAYHWVISRPSASAPYQIAVKSGIGWRSGR